MLNKSPIMLIKTLLILVILPMLILPIFAQSSDMSITVSADKGSDTIMMSGNTISNLVDVTFRVASPSGNNIVAIGQISPDNNGNFVTELEIDQMWSEDGFYTITAMQSVVQNSLYTLSIPIEINNGLAEKTLITQSALEPGSFNFKISTGAEIKMQVQVLDYNLIRITGTTDMVNTDITITTTAPNGNVVSINQIAPMLDGRFIHVIEIMNNSLWEQDGIYTVTAQQFDSSAYSTSIEVDIIDYSANIFFNPAFAQESLIFVQTNDRHYEEGDTIVISGQVTTVIGSTSITLQLFTDGTLVDLVQIRVAQDGTYSHIILAEGPLWKYQGQYIVRASYGEHIAETEFSYVPGSEATVKTETFDVNAGSKGTFDVEYSIKGGTVKDIIINSNNFSLEVLIDTTDDGSITLDMPREFIGAEKQDGKDEMFIILIDGINVAYEESAVFSESRIITVNFEQDDSKIEIIGTKLSTDETIYAYAQLTEESITVQTDKSSYSNGETIVITGEVRDLYAGTPVSVIVTDPNDDLMLIAQVKVGADKKFSTEIGAGGSLMKVKGAYIVTVQYGTVNRSATTTFYFESATITPPISSPTNTNCGAGTVFDEVSNSCILITSIPIQDLELTDRDLQKFEKKIKKWNAIIGNFERNADKFESKGNIERADYLRFKATIYESMIEHLENLIY